MEANTVQSDGVAFQPPTERKLALGHCSSFKPKIGPSMTPYTPWWRHSCPSENATTFRNSERRSLCMTYNVLKIGRLGAFVGLGRPSADQPLRVGPVQAAILMIIRDFPDHAHGVGIATVLRCEFDREITDAQTYVGLRRLESRGLIAARSNNHSNGQETTPSKSQGRRGRPHKTYFLTASGKRALESVVAGNSESAGAQPRGVSSDGRLPPKTASVVG